MIDPGKLRTKLIYQTALATTNHVGQPVASWVDAAVVRACVEPLSAREVWWASQVHATTTHKITCRYNSAIAPTGRFKVAGTDRVLNITGVADREERHVETTVMAAEARD